MLNIPFGIDALRRAQLIRKAANSCGFTCFNPEILSVKLKEEINETEVEIKRKDRQKTCEELGDVFYVLCCLCNYCDLDFEQLLRTKIYQQFGINLAEHSLDNIYHDYKKVFSSCFADGDVCVQLRKCGDSLNEIILTGVYKANLSQLENGIFSVLLAIIEVSLYLDINPETALENTNNKFIKRFTYIENALEQNGLLLTKDNLNFMQEKWEEAKKIEKEEDFRK